MFKALLHGSWQHTQQKGTHNKTGAFTADGTDFVYCPKPAWLSQLESLVSGETVMTD